MQKIKLKAWTGLKNIALIKIIERFIRQNSNDVINSRKLFIRINEIIEKYNDSGIITSEQKFFLKK